MDSIVIGRHRTALHRIALSRPVRLALEEGLITQESSFFDYGCGHGDDITQLRSKGINCTGWDPFYHPNEERVESDVVNLGYIINVIESQFERITTLKEAWALSRKLLIVSARLSIESKDELHTRFNDGWLTKTGTFQKYYEQYELRDWIDEILDVESTPAGPGIFYIFRDSELRQTYLASRYRRRSATPRQRTSDFLFDKYQYLLAPLMDFVASRGRLPYDSELETSGEIRKELGSIKRAFKLICRVTGEEQWIRIREDRSQDLLVYIALSKFNSRPRLSQLPEDIQFDIKVFFSNYKRACKSADDLLFSVGNLEILNEAFIRAAVGKLTQNAFYIYSTALSLLPPVLRIYEGCARAYIGNVEEANIIKLHRHTPQVSYLAYPTFEEDAHPALAASLSVHFQTFRINYREYKESENPPILHRKEEFIPLDHPLRAKFANLTQEEEEWHLYDAPELIGSRKGWQKVLQEKGVRIVDHKVYSDKGE